MLRIFAFMIALLGLTGSATTMTRTGRDNAPRSLGVTVPFACAVLGISNSLGYELIARNEFPCRIIRAGRRIIVPRSELSRVLGLTPETPDGANVEVIDVR